MKNVLSKSIKVDLKIFDRGFVKGCDISKCGGECCNYGVYMEKSDKNIIDLIIPELISIMDETQTKDPGKWFDAPEEDDDFEDGFGYGTNTFNGKCVFLDKDGFCSLQKLAISKGLHKWTYKPIYCILFPLVIYQKTLMVDEEHLSCMHYCSLSENHSSTVFEACKEEIRYVFGEEFFNMLEDYNIRRIKNALICKGA